MLIFLANNCVAYIDPDKAIVDQFERVGKYKIKSTPKDLCDEKTKDYVPIIEELYALKFKDRPEYQKLAFMFKKILLDMHYLPVAIFDWSLTHGDEYQRIDSYYSISISSSGIDSDQEPGEECTHNILSA